MTETKTLKQLCRQVQCTSTYGAHLDWDEQDDWQKQANSYRVKLRYRGRQLSVDYWMGVGLSGDPDAESVLECLLSDAIAGQDTFEGFCMEFGYNEDSRKAKRIYDACVRMRNKLERLLGDDFDDFLESER